MRLNKPARNLFLLLLIVVAGGLAYWLYTPNYPPRPDFTLPDLSGTPRSISEFDDQVVLLNFWATWCVPCREEIPMLIEAQAELDDAGLQVIGIAIDRPKPTAAFAQRFNINYPVLVDPAKAAHVQDRFTALTDSPSALLPYSVIIDRQGRIRADVTGKLNRSRLNQLVLPLLDRTSS